MNERTSTIPPLVNLIVEAGIVTVYLGALIFVAGWSYADRYFAELGLNISAVDGLETTNFSAYALWVFRDGLLTIAIIIAALILTVVLFREDIGRIRATWGTAIAAALAVLSLFGAGFLGSERANGQIDQLFTHNYKSMVRVIVHPVKDTALAEYLSKRPGLSTNGCLRKIYMDRKNLYAYAGYENEKGPNQQILIIPLKNVAVIETLPISDLCVI